MMPYSAVFNNATSVMGAYISKDEVARSIIAMDMADVKKKFKDPKAFEAACNTFSVNVSALVQKLERECALVQRMHKARGK